MPYLGNTPTTQSFTPGTDYFNGTGSQTVFTLTRPVVSVNDIEIFVNNVAQAPNSGYTVSGNTLTFDAAPSAGTNNVYVRYLTTTTQVIAPSTNSVSYASLTPDMQQDIGISFKNRIINGDMRIDQRNNGASITSSGYVIDRWQVATNTSNFTANRSTVVPAGQGFINSLYVKPTATITPSIGTYAAVGTSIEGFNMADFQWGTVNARAITVSFWVRSSKTGSYSFTMKNGLANRAYSTSYTIIAANNWEYKTIIIPGDTTGSWDNTNGLGSYVDFWLAGSNTISPTVNTWVATNINMNSSQVNFFDSTFNEFYLTGVQLEVGTTATAFDFRSIATELQLCKRYYQLIYGLVGTGFASTSIFSNPEFPVEMRTAPSIGVTGSVNFTYAGVSDHNQSPATVSQVGSIGRQNAFVRFNNYTGITSGIPYIRNTNTHALTLSAELT